MTADNSICINQEVCDDYTLFNGDSCEIIRGIPDSSVDMIIYSPPFSNLYIYSDSMADMGNCANDKEFFEHYGYLIPELLRVTVPGRIAVVHCKDLPKYANTHGTTGLIDFPGRIIAEHEKHGWSYHSRITIWKCPVTERERTNNNGLLHKTIERDRSQVRQGMPDYLLVFRRPPIDGTLMSAKPVNFDSEESQLAGTIGLTKYIGESSPLISPDHPSPYARKKKLDRTSVAIWQRYADPVWWDINQTYVLNKREGTDEKDERHICPLQIDLIRRCVQLWSEPGDVVLSPFAGIGSEGYGAIKEGRRFLGIELKSSYFEKAIENLEKVREERRQERLF